MPATYQNLGVHFLYPENWTITEEQASKLPLSMTIECPGGGFWSLAIYTAVVDPKELVLQVCETMRQEFDTFESTRADCTLEGIAVVGYEMDFYCLDLLVTARAQSFQIADKTFLVLFQAENREYEKLEPVFEAITLSLLRDAVSS